MFNPLLVPELRELLADGNDAILTEVLADFHPASIAEFTEGLPVDEAWRLLEHVPLIRRAVIFTFYPPARQVEMVTGSGQERISRLLEAMSHDDRVDLVRRLDQQVVDGLLPLVAKADREDIRKLLSYPEQSAGALMTTDYASLPRDITVADALARLRQQAPSAETIYYVYVLDDERHLLGFVSLRHLIVAKPTALIRDIMQEEVIALRADSDRESAAQELAKYDFLAMPVVDEQRRLVGIITHDDIIDVVTEEATEDVLKLGAVAPMTEHYLDASFATIWRKRSFWLSCLFVAELLTFSVMTHFEDAIKAVVALNLFVPLCISTGGNSGSQAATLITRAMALGQVELRDWWRVVKHELAMGLALGATLGVIGFVRVAVAPDKLFGGVDRWMLSVVIGQVVSVICLWGTLVGATLPLVFRKIGWDPGYASGPFVATFVDVTGLLIYFSIASAYLL